MNEHTILFKKAYEEGFKNKKLNFDIWLEKFGLNSILLDKLVTLNDKPELFFNRNKEIEKIAQFIGAHEKQKKMSYINIVGSEGIGKTALLNMVQYSYKKVNTKEKIIYDLAEKFSEKLESEDEEINFYFEVFLGNLENKKIAIIDDCDKDILHMEDNIKSLYSFPIIFLFCWRPMHWYRFKMQTKSSLDMEDCIYLKPLEINETIELIKEKVKNLKNKNVKSIAPFTEQSLKVIAELSKGIPIIALKLYSLSMRRCFQFNKAKITEEDIKKVHTEEGFKEVEQFLEECTPITKRILKTIVVESSQKGVSIDQVSEEVDLDRTSVFYHIQKMRKCSILEEHYIKKSVFFSIKKDFIPLVDQFLWEKREI